MKALIISDGFDLSKLLFAVTFCKNSNIIYDYLHISEHKVNQNFDFIQSQINYNLVTSERSSIDLFDIQANSYKLVFVCTQNLDAKIASLLVTKYSFNAAFDVDDLKLENEQIKIKRAIFSNTLKCSIKYKEPLVIAFTNKKEQGSYNLINCNFTYFDNTKAPQLYVQTNSKLNNIDDLSHAKKVIVLGQGVGSLEKCNLIIQKAKKHGFDFGATRTVVLNAWCSMDRLCGVSGIKLQADLVITLGVSGASAFNYALLDCKKVIAVNNDENANIKNVCDVFIKADLMHFVDKVFP